MGHTAAEVTVGWQLGCSALWKMSCKLQTHAGVAKGHVWRIRESHRHGYSFRLVDFLGEASSGLYLQEASML